MTRLPSLDTVLTLLGCCNADQLLEGAAFHPEADGSDPAFTLGLRLALVRELRLRNLREGGPRSVRDLPVDAVLHAARLARDMTGDSLDLLVVFDWAADHRLAPWLVSSERWSDSADAVASETIDAATACGRLAGQTVVDVRFDKGTYTADEAAWARAELLLTSGASGADGDVCILDARDNVSGYDHSIVARCWASDSGLQDDSPPADFDVEDRLPVVLTRLRGSRIDQADTGPAPSTDGFSLQLRAGRTIVQFTAKTEGVLIWRRSPCAPTAPALGGHVR